MCGIAGILRLTNHQRLRHDLAGMSTLLAHRGPDGEGFFADEEAGIGLMHRRLSIIDLAGGKQPLVSDDGALVLIANGEIYNYRELRQRPECRGYAWRTQSDCEVILPLFRHHGCEAFKLLDGMFALAIWDARRAELTLARDHVGIKPLHLWQTEQGLAFASEMKAFYALAEFQPELSHPELSDFMNLRYLPGQKTLLKGVTRLAPATWLRTSLKSGQPRTTSGRFWSPPTPSSQNKGVTTVELRAELEDAVQSQLVSDVEVGCYLSGGLDSSSVAASAIKSLSGLRTFTLGFGEVNDENADARAVAQALGTNHTDMLVQEELFDSLEASIRAVEEPKINHLQGYILAREASKHVKVALSGLGGDELFAGYARNEIAWSFRKGSALMRSAGSGLAARVGNLLAAFPTLRGRTKMRTLLFGLSLGDPAAADGLLRNAFEMAPALLDSPFSADFMRQQAAGNSLAQRARDSFSNVQNSADIGEDWLAGAMHHEFLTKLPNDYLLNEDRISMAHGLEVRVPLLRVRLIEAARKLALREHFEREAGMKGQGTQMVGVRGKASMRRIVKGFVPDRVLEKAKWGFQVSAWQQAEAHLLPLARELLTKDWLDEVGCFDTAWVQRVLSAPISPRMNWHYYTLWMMLGLRLWWKTFLRGGLTQGLR